MSALPDFRCDEGMDRETRDDADTTMEYMPLFFDIRQRRCVVVGNGFSAVLKAQLLLRAGADVWVVSPEPEPDLIEFTRQGRVTAIVAHPTDAHFRGAVLVVIALDDAQAAAEVAVIARRHTVAINAVDRPELCSFIVPALVDRSPVVVAISTAGAAPVLGKKLRARLEAELHPQRGQLARAARSLRPKVADRLTTSERRQFWEHVMQDHLQELLLEEDSGSLSKRMTELLESGTLSQQGAVYVVTVPVSENPELMTLRAVRLLQQADRVWHHPDLELRVLDLVRRDAIREPFTPGMDDRTIATSLTSLARDGERVVYLGTNAGQLLASIRSEATRSGVLVSDAC
ncbi:MAG: NAD(P)-dependent oxidoreductase [Pseudomonadota bacterium]